MTGIHRERPGAADLSSATGAPAVALGADIWMSPGVSNAYAIGTDAGRVIVNTGLAFEGPLHRKAFDGVIPGRTATIVVSQGHPDHWAASDPSGIPTPRSSCNRTTTIGATTWHD